MVFVIFKFNRKTSRSKLSVQPSLKFEKEYIGDNYEEFNKIDRTYTMEYLNWLNPVKGLPEVALYPPHETFRTQLLCITLNNKGELASTNIKVTLLFKGYGTQDRDEMSKLEKLYLSYRLHMKRPFSPFLKRKLFFKKKIVIKVPYIGADENKIFMIAPIRAQFRETELSLISIKANGHSYFKKKFFESMVINHYSHPYLSGISTSGNNVDDKNILIGFKNKDEKLKFNNQENYWKEVLKWLQSLYVEWKK